MEIHCPNCSSSACKKNGFTRHGKQNHLCLDCGKQFSLDPTSKEEDDRGDPPIYCDILT